MHGTLATVFKSRPIPLGLHEAVRRFVESMDGVKTKVSKTQVSFAVDRQFAWTWLPPRTKHTPENCIVVSFALPRRLKDKRVWESLQVYPGRWMHHVVIVHPDDLDATLRGWLKRAHAFGKKPR